MCKSCIWSNLFHLSVLNEFPSCENWVEKARILTKKQPKSERVESQWAKSEWAKSEQLKFPQITMSSMELFFDIVTLSLWIHWICRMDLSVPWEKKTRWDTHLSEDQRVAGGRCAPSLLHHAAAAAELGSSRNAMDEVQVSGRSAEVTRSLGPAPGFCCCANQPPAAVGAQGAQSLPGDQSSPHQLFPPTSTAAALSHRIQLPTSHHDWEPELCVE